MPFLGSSRAAWQTVLMHQMEQRAEADPGSDDNAVLSHPGAQQHLEGIF